MFRQFRQALVLLLPVVQQDFRIDGIDAGRHMVGIMFFAPVDPLLRLRQALAGRDQRTVGCRSRRADVRLLFRIFTEDLHASDRICRLLDREYPGSLDALVQSAKVLRILLQFPVQQLQIALTFLFPGLRRLQGIAVVVEHNAAQIRCFPNGAAILSGKALVDASLIVDARIQSGQPLRDKIGVFSMLQIGGIVVALVDKQCLRPLLGRQMRELNQLMDIRVQILVSIHGKIPFPVASLHHRVAGSGKVIHPRKVKYLIGIAFRHLPGPVIGAGVGYDHLAGQYVPQGLECLKAFFNTADLVFYNQSNGQKRF